MHQRSIDVPEQVIKCAPKQTRCVDSDPMDQSGNTIIAMLQKAAELSTTIAAAPGQWQVSFLVSFEPPKIGSIS